MALNVCKFGGTSLASADQIRRVCDILLADKSRRIVALSAPGKREKSDTKVTDLLIAVAEEYLKTGSAEKSSQKVIKRFSDIGRDLGLEGEAGNSVSDGLNSRLSAPTDDPERFTDGIKALGEEHCARLVARYLKSQGVEAHYIDPKDSGMVLSDEAGNARVLPIAYERLSKLRDRTGILCYPGFYGYTPSGALVTFPRGGTDITGSVLAAAVKADLYENFTDVDSVYAAHPEMVEKPEAIAQLSYAEMRELSYCGFGVFHDEALEPVYRAHVPVRIANTNNPSAPGTQLLAVRKPRKNRPVVGIASSNGFSSLNLSKYLMNREKGFGRRLLAIIEEAGLSYEHMPSSIDSISLVLKTKELTPAIREIVAEGIKKDLTPDCFEIHDELALVMVVGEGMRSTVGMAARATKALADAKINIEMMNQGASEISMMFGIKDNHAKKAVKALYEEFFRD